MPVLFYLYSFLFILVFAIYTKFQIQDEKAGFANSKSRWHPYGMLLRLMVFGAFILYMYISFTWKDLFLAGAIDIALWDILINILAFGMPWWYGGKVSGSDKLLKNIKWIAYAAIIIAAVVVRFTF